MIARAIAKEAGEDDYEIIEAALLHDLDEVVTGDPPTTTKARAREWGWDLNALYKGISGREIPPRQEMIIHIADKLADLHWLDENRLGKHANEVMKIITQDWSVMMGNLRDNDPGLHKATQAVAGVVFSSEFVI
jgi:5'-deoxynucleotidase YfbR-like HD superfamily hydrolase